MPFRINLLAEQLAVEEQRRRDPVKRAIWIAASVVAVAVLCSLFLQFRVFRISSALAEVENRYKAVEARSRTTAEQLRNTAEIERRLKALRTLAANRFLWANTLNELQNTVVDDIQVVRIKGEQTYTAVPPPTPPAGSGAARTDKPTSRGSRTTKSADASKPVPVREKVTLIIEAKDFAGQSDLNHTKFMSAITTAPLFQNTLRKPDGVSLKDRMPPQPDPLSPARQFILFSIECRYPEKERIL